MKKLVCGLVIGLVIGNAVAISNAGAYSDQIQTKQYEMIENMYTKLKSIDKYLYKIDRKLEIENQQY